MAQKIPLKANFTGSDVTSLGEFASGDTIAIGYVPEALPKSGGVMTGAITTNSTFDGVDIAVRDAILTSTTTTAGAALPKAGGTMTNNLTLADSVRLNVGTSADLKIHHTSGNSFIEDSGTGQLFIKASAIDFQNAGGTESLAQMVVDGAVNLFYNGTKKLETTSAGITAQGRLEIQTPNDGNTHLVQRIGSTAGSYGYVDLELVSPNSTAAGLPRLDLQIGNTTVASFLRGGGMTVTGTTRMNGPGQTGGPASSGTTQVNTVAEFSGAGNGRLYIGILYCHFTAVGKALPCYYCHIWCGLS